MNASVMVPRDGLSDTSPVSPSIRRNIIFPGVENSGRSFLSSMCAFMNSIQIGSAARAPSSFGPRGFFSS